ncbi:hypothetical protein F5144DRAFT_598192 [Chaetomium tenue]|uniref:Uncharacterized protein n=1 Tax=Chaetomium tenue TaxID=1854479 RepID=A0ACB7PNG5_9PEZI|nr:hypothetical protein F5144DRAFT_598192 [Chaetomium globosum]
MGAQDELPDRDLGGGAVAGLLIGLPLYQLQGTHFQGAYYTPLALLLAVGLAAAVLGVRTFGEEKQIYWREASSGHSGLAYYVGKVLATFPMFLSNLLSFYCIYGLVSIMSMLVRRKNGPLMVMIVSLIIGVFWGYGPPLYPAKEWHPEWLWRLCPGVWLTEAYFDNTWLS